MKEKIRNTILVVSTGLGGGGAERLLLDLVVYGLKQGITVISLTADDSFAASLRRSGARVVILDFKRSFFFSLYTFIKEVWTTRPQIILGWMYHGAFFASLARLISFNSKLIWSIHHGRLTAKLSPISTLILARLLAGLSYMLPKHIVYCSCLAKIENERIGFCSSRGKVISNGFDTSKYHFTKRDPLGRVKFVSVARWDVYKNHRRLFSVFKQVVQNNSNVSLHLYGAGIDYDNSELMGLIAEYSLGDVVELHGFTGSPELIYGDYDFSLLSSDFESFGNVLVESMLCGTPCITTDVGESRSIVHQYGFIVENDSQFVEAILIACDLAVSRLSHYRSLRSSASEYARQHFDVNVYLREYRELIYG